MQKNRWSSQFSFVMAATGAAVGLGNIWKFPYMAGDNGGSAFVLIYLICVVSIGLPLLAGEIVLGKLGRSNPISSIERLRQVHTFSPRWAWVGWWGSVGLILILSFYSVVAGWSLGYLARALKGSFMGQSAQAIDQLWQDFLANPLEMLFWHSCFMAMTMKVVASGLKKGIETLSNWLMPLLFFVLIGLVFYAAISSHFAEGAAFLLSFKSAQITTAVWIEALGHAFFTLAIGAGCMLVYGCYLPVKTPILSNISWVAGLDVLIALLAGLAIFPLVFEYQLPLEAGPGLMFKILPIAFAKMPQGQIIGSLFFLTLWFAAWSSTISMAEPLLLIGIERWGWSRKRSACLIGLLCWFLGWFSILSFNLWKDYKIFNRSIFEGLADLATNVILPLGGLGLALILHKIPKSVLHDNLLTKNRLLFEIWFFLIRYVVPSGIGVIFLKHVSVL